MSVRPRLRSSTIVLACALAQACASGPPTLPPPLVDAADTDATSIDPTRRAALLDAWQRVERAPRDEDAIVWYGRQTAYLGDYRRAIEIYSYGLSVHPESIELRRHRGHREITLRRFDRAERDLRAAALRLRGTPDRVELDGLPNAKGIPTSTLHTNVWYHLGLASYLRGDFAAARQSYLQCLARTNTRDMEVATRYWLYLATLRADPAVPPAENRDAALVLEPVSANFELLENHDYHRLLLLFRGELSAAAVRAAASANDLGAATIGYGLAMHAWLHEGDLPRARELLHDVVAEARPAAFGCIAASTDLQRLEALP